MSDGLFLAVTAALAFLPGVLAAVSGFGIGSLLTPLLAARVGTKLAVAAVSVPHCVATAFRFWMMRKDVDRRLLWSFGLMSAAGGLAGALLHASADSPVLTLIFGGLLIFTGAMGLTGLSDRLRFRGWVACVAGAVSGLLGGWSRAAPCKAPAPRPFPRSCAWPAASPSTAASSRCPVPPRRTGGTAP